MLEQWEKDIIESKIRKPIYSLEWLTADEQVIDEAIIDVVSGNVNFDASNGNNNRRSGNLTIKNLNKEYIPSPTSKLFINHKVRLKSGFIYGDNQNLWFNQGIYVIGNPSLVSVLSSQREVSLQLNDKWLLLNGEISGKLKTKFEIPVGTRIDAVVKSLVILAGETKYLIDPIQEVVPYTIKKEVNDTIANILIELANLYSYTVYYDNNGILNFRKAIQPEDIEQTPISSEFTTGGIYLQSNRELQWDLVRNSILVYGSYEDSSGIQHSGVASDTTGNDFSIDIIGERLEILSLNEIYSDDLCTQRARKELLDRIKQQETVQISIIPDYSLKLDDVIKIEDSNNGLSGNYLIQSISYNLSYDSIMTLGLWKTRNI